MENKIVVGRDEEKALLDNILTNASSDLVAVYGRRRVGKTYLIRTYLKQHIAFEFSGIHNVSTEVQLENFAKAISLQLNNKKKIVTPNNWFEAFDMLSATLKSKLKAKKAVVFLDEFPWMQTPKSNFLPAFENFWNTWAVRQNNLAIILCGSAASWMIQNVVRNKGGLHNRLTQKIVLQPFTLAETEAFIKSKKINLNRSQIAQLYMTLGGIPHYLNNIKPGLSATQIIDKECFSKAGFLFNEFSDLFRALFDDSERHLKVIRALATKPMGLNRNQLIKVCRLQSGGSTTNLLEELTASGFITPYIPFGKKNKDSIFKLIDEYSIFYLKFMESNRSGTKGAWIKLSNSASYKSWCGFAFETVCLKHIGAIKKALGIEGLYSETSVWRTEGTKTKSGAQIDLLIDRKDQCINLCEIKFYDTSFSIDKKYATSLENKKQMFKQTTKTRKQIFVTAITSKGLLNNSHSIGLIDSEVTLDDLFVSVSNDN